jgi:hypothetical protein
VVEIAVEVARSVAVAVDRAFETATVAVEGTGNNQPNYHIVVGDIDASSSSSFVTRRAFSLRRASYRCSVVGLDVNVFGGFDASLSLFVVRRRHHLFRRRRRRRRRSCRRRRCVVVVVAVVVVVVRLHPRRCPVIIAIVVVVVIAFG